ncbi:MAG TPA: glycosyltransferase family 2 protein [Patescibacteria group bacterium]|nr:glycosyltransferase family 2 protein [Patescibacteria group bacterium]
MKRLSIIILNYNTREFLKECLLSLRKVADEVDFEIIVSDNGSSDDSVEMLKKEFPDILLIENKKNLGFAAGNNTTRKFVRGEYILFLNSDTVMNRETLKETIKYMDEHEDVGAMTCKIELPEGKLDKDARRAFITPWIGLVHLFLKLDRIFPESKYFSKYWYGFISPDIEHETDVLQGAFLLTRKKILESIDWFDEDYFLDGEDIDLCWRIKERDWKIIYYPKVSIVHIKGASKGKIESRLKEKVPLKERLKYRMAGVDSMEIFYRKRLWNKYPLILNLVVVVGIKTMKAIRFIKTVLLG